MRARIFRRVVLLAGLTGLAVSLAPVPVADALVRWRQHGHNCGSEPCWEQVEMVRTRPDRDGGGDRTLEPTGMYCCGAPDGQVCANPQYGQH